MLSTVQSADPCAIVEADVFGDPVESLALPRPLESGDARGRERYRRAFMNGLTSIGAKAITLLSSLILVPLTFRHLGPEHYGVWMTVTSLIQFLTFADLGIGNGLTLRVAAAHGREDLQDVAKSISCAFFFLLAICVVLCTVTAAGAWFTPWQATLARLSKLPSSELGCVAVILILTTAWSMPFGTVLRVQLGSQTGYVADLWNAAGNLAALGGVLLALRTSRGLPILVLAVAGLPLVVLILNWLVEFSLRQPDLRPRISLFETKTALQLASTGSLFFVQQCFGLIYYASDNLVIAHSMGSAAVARYAIEQRLFSVGLVTQYLILPLWPAINEAISRGDHAWAKRTTRRAIGFALLLSGVCGVLLLAVSRYVVQRWTGVDPGAPGALQIGFAAWVVVVGYVATMNTLLNRPALMVRHLLLFGAASLASLASKMYFAHRGSLAGVIWSTVIGFGVVYAVPAALLALRARDLNADGVLA